MSAKLNIRPLHDRVIVERVEEETKSPGGILIPDNAKEKPQRGIVVAVGLGKKCEKTGEHCKLDVKVGDRVLFGKYAGTEIKNEGKEYLVMREEDIIAVEE
jgi:chaperonin GroES